MKRKRKVSALTRFFNSLANQVTRVFGKPMAFIVSFMFIIEWVLTGPIFKFPNTWQLVVNTCTTIITFLMVFIIKQTQNKDTVAVHLKLNDNAESNHQLKAGSSISKLRNPTTSTTK